MKALNNTYRFILLDIWLPQLDGFEVCKRIELTPKEFELLVHLASNPGKTCSGMNLLNKVWGYEFDGIEHKVNSHINRLRSKIEKDMSRPEFILTTWGLGYKFREI